MFTQCNSLSDKYEFGYNGKYKDNEIAGIGNSYDYGFRMYNPRIGRFFTVDPLAKKYPWYSTYQFAGNNSIHFIDLDGLEPAAPRSLFPSWMRTGAFGMKHPMAAGKIGTASTFATNISSNAARFARNTGLPESPTREGSHVNAYRHALWQATITKEFGSTIAQAAGYAHEESPRAVDAPFIQTSFTSNELAKADETADLLNNILGRAIGNANPNATMNELASKVLDDFHSNGLNVVVEVRDVNNKIIGYEVQNVKLTDQQYADAKKALNGTDENGKNDEDKKNQEENEKKGEDTQKKENAASTNGPKI